MRVSAVEVKPEHRKWQGGVPDAVHSQCLVSIVDHRDSSLVVYYNDSCLILFLLFGLSWRSRAWRGSFTAYKSISVSWVSWPLHHKVHIYLMCLTPLLLWPILSNHDFNSEILRRNRGMGLLLHRSVVSERAGQLLYLHLKHKQFSPTQKAQKCFFYCFPFFLPRLCLSLSHWCRNAKEERTRVIERGGDLEQGPWRNVREGRQERQKGGKRWQDEKVNGGWWRQLSESQH